MSRRKSSVLLPFNLNASKTVNETAENVTVLRTKKTPANRRRTLVEVVEPELDENGLEVFEDLKQKMWSVYRLSDLNSFDNTKPTTFPRYERILSRYLVNSFTQAVTLQAKFKLKHDIQGFDQEDLPVHIKVEDVQLSQPRLVYEGLLLSARKSGGSKTDGVVHLPVLLARGPRAVREKVHDCLSAVFSSSIHEVSFPAEDMHWMIAAWSGFINESRNNKEVSFMYGIPSRTDTIQCQYSVNFIKDLWSCIHDKDNPVVELSEVKRFYSSLIKHTKNTIGLNLAAVPLIMYKTPDFELHTVGKVKVSTLEFIPRILHFIADLCDTQNMNDFSQP
ncbi:hypothetical protein DAPPUDRAFT_222696 [Daphnia pulex]|uniref:Centromere protein L n=1 Tax=Daphnia pulex TaxID=6669 RepID=E9G6N9_DAPPU|nr:hypothetical protein DAPPUDRAFT_222696 [Daphnia pulex]|eukprot:EFX84777.1 hypothetical protein DAPPUDRAFT_222696 [Daphnia pulex]